MPVAWRTSLLLGNPENRRVSMWQAALRESGRPESVVVGYEDLLLGRVDLPPLLHQADVIRLDSPGENTDVERLLIVRGAKCAGRDDLCPQTLGAALTERGRIVHPGLWAAGYRDLLAELQNLRDEARCRSDAIARLASVAERGLRSGLRSGPAGVLRADASSRRGCRWLSDPGAVSSLFDKPASQRELMAAGIPVPRPLPPVNGYEQFRAVMRDANCSRVFVKLPGGSSASGVVALDVSSRRISAVTSTEVVSGAGGIRLYNSLRVRRYDQESQVATLIDSLAADGPLHVEEWVPKASFDGRTFDLRIVVIGGEPQHVVMRTSRGPLTNLHLGNRRGNLAAMRRALPAASWPQVLGSCRRLARRFPGCLMLGVDVGLSAGFRKHFVIEVNAFGDLLPGVLHQGRDTYAAQVAAIGRTKRA